MSDYMSDYQVIIIGGGPAGLTAGIYVTRAGLNALLLEKISPGGQITSTEMVENYPGFPQGISGFEIGRLIEEQATGHGLKIELAEVNGIELAGDKKTVKTSSGNYTTQAVIIAGGAEHARLGVPGEEELVGRGISYCATCDGAFFRDRVVAVVGGGDIAITDALFLSRMVSKVFVIHRRNQLRAARILQERAFANANIEMIWDTIVEAIDGEGSVEGVRLRNVKTGEKSNLKLDGVFMAVGTKPNTEYLSGILRLNQDGTIPVNIQMETEIPGIFAAGDIREGSIRQVVAAAGDGAVAAMAAEKHITQG